MVMCTSNHRGFTVSSGNAPPPPFKFSKYTLPFHFSHQALQYTQPYFLLTHSKKKNVSPRPCLFLLSPFWPFHVLLACLWNHDPAQCPYIYPDFSHMPYSSTLKMEAIHSSGTVGYFYPTTWHILNDGTVIFMAPTWLFQNSQKIKQLHWNKSQIFKT